MLGRAVRADPEAVLVVDVPTPRLPQHLPAALMGNEMVGQLLEQSPVNFAGLPKLTILFAAPAKDL
jgi:hypothetical protein